MFNFKEFIKLVKKYMFNFLLKIKNEKKNNNKIVYFYEFLKNKNILNNNIIKKNNYGIIIFIIINIIIFIFLFFYLYSADIMLLLYPDKIITYLNINIDKDAAGFTFLGAFLPFSHYFISLKNLYVGVFLDYKKKVYNRTILLLQYIHAGGLRPLNISKKRSIYMKTFLTNHSVRDKSQVYIQHRIGSFDTKNFILKHKQFGGFDLYDKQYEDGGIYNYFFRYFYKYTNFREKFGIEDDNLLDVKWHRLTGFWTQKQIERGEPVLDSYSDQYKVHLAYIHPYINKVANNPIDKLFFYLPKAKKYQHPVRLSGRAIQVAKKLTRIKNPYPEDHWVPFPQHDRKLWYRKFPSNFVYNKTIWEGKINYNYYIFTPIIEEYAYYHTNIINKMPGLYYPLYNKKRFYEGLLKKKIAKPYNEFTFVRTPPSIFYGDFLREELMQEDMFNTQQIRHYDGWSVGNGWKWTRKYGYAYAIKYHTDVSLHFMSTFKWIFWNWNGVEQSLYDYFFDNRYQKFRTCYPPPRFYLIYFIPIPDDKIFSGEPVTRTLMAEGDKPYNELTFLYRSNVFWSLYSLFLTDTFSKNKANPLFDGVDDNILTSMAPKIRRFENAQFNEFLVDSPDYNIYDTRRASIRPLDYYNKQMPDVEYEIKKSQTNGNFFLVSRKFNAVEDYMFFKNFFFRFKYRLEDAFYKKTLNKLGEFYIYYLDLTSDKIFFNIYIFFDYIWSFFFNKIKSFFISFFFVIIYYFYYHIIPLFIFLYSLQLGNPFPILIMEFLGYLKLLFSYISGTFVYYYFQKGTYFTIFHSSSFSLLILLVLKILFFFFLLYMIMLLLEDYFNEMEETLRLPFEILGLSFILITYAFFISFNYFIGPLAL